MTLNNMEMLEKANTSPGLFLKDNNPHKHEPFTLNLQPIREKYCILFYSFYCRVTADYQE